MAPELTDRRRMFLATSPAGPRAQRLAFAVVLVSVGIFLAAAPFARVPLTQIWGFIPVYESALVITDLITAILLFGQFGFLRSRALLVLASGYLFTAVMTVSHALTFPGLFSPTGLLGAGPQSTAWLYMFWHGGFPLLVITYALLKDEERETKPRGHAGVAILSSVAAVLVLAGGLTLLATPGQDSLPAIMRGNRYTPAMIGVVSSTWVLSLLALVTLWWRRPHAVLDLWLMVVMCAWLFDIALAAVLNAGRFDLGFYAGRGYGLLAASFVLMVLLIENGKLYAGLVAAHEGEHRERARAQERAIALTAVNAALATEVAERRRAEAGADAANTAKSEFLSRMSHELRTPLNAILGFGQLLEMEGDPSRDPNSVQQILTAGRHLLTLINEVLDIARVEAGRLSLSPEPVRLSDAIGGVLDLAHPLASERRITVATTGAAVADRYVLADSQRLHQVLLNLVSNAIKYNRPGGGLSVICDAASAGRLRITVSDTGPGIAPALQARLFTPFDRLGAEAKGVEGTGLGLTLSKRLVEAMGGVIGVESAEGQGSRFWVELPEADAPITQLGTEGRDATIAPSSDERGTLVYIEDNLSNVQLVERILAYRPGVRLIPAMQGRLGLELAREHHPDAILLDLHLPDIPGDQILRMIRADQELRRTPTIILSADATPGQIKRLLDAGADDYLTKPLDVQRFLAIVDRVLGQDRLARAEMLSQPGS